MTTSRRDPFFGTRGRTLEMRLTQQTLSLLVGTTRQRVNQLIQEWEARQLVKAGRGSLTILELEELEANFKSA